MSACERKHPDLDEVVIALMKKAYVLESTPSPGIESDAKFEWLSGSHWAEAIWKTILFLAEIYGLRDATLNRLINDRADRYLSRSLAPDFIVPTHVVLSIAECGAWRRPCERLMKGFLKSRESYRNAERLAKIIGRKLTREEVFSLASSNYFFRSNLTQEEEQHLVSFAFRHLGDAGANEMRNKIEERLAAAKKDWADLL